MAKKDAQVNKEMSLEEARKWRASLAKPELSSLTEDQKRESWRLYWAQNKASYGRGKELEEIIWLHLKAIKMDSPSQFEQGAKHFGLKKIS